MHTIWLITWWSCDKETSQWNTDGWRCRTNRNRLMRLDCGCCLTAQKSLRSRKPCAAPHMVCLDISNPGRWYCHKHCYRKCFSRKHTLTNTWFPKVTCCIFYRMDAFKEAAFCRSLTTFHEIFISAIWHEAVANRKATEVRPSLWSCWLASTSTQTESTAILSSGLITAADKTKTMSYTRRSTPLSILSMSGSTKSLLSTLSPDTASWQLIHFMLPWSVPSKGTRCYSTSASLSIFTY